LRRKDIMNLRREQKTSQESPKGSEERRKSPELSHKALKEKNLSKN